MHVKRPLLNLIWSPTLPTLTLLPFHPPLPSLGLTVVLRFSASAMTQQPSSPIRFCCKYRICRFDAGSSRRWLIWRG